MSSITSTKIGNRINAFREQKGLTQETLSAQTGLKQPLICQLEKGQRQLINPQHLEKIANALEVPVSALYGTDNGQDEAFVFSLPDPWRKLVAEISALPISQQRKIGEVIEKLLELS
jgi:transcriptional regulator with XRE-family HTH domain